MMLTLTCVPDSDRSRALRWESKSSSQQGFFYPIKNRTEQNLLGSGLHAFISLMPNTYYPFAFIYEKHIKYCHCMEGNTCPYLELVYQYTTFKTEQSRCQQTATTSINSKVCDMMVDSFILSKTFMFRLVHARH